MIIMQRLDNRQKVDKPFFDYVARTSPRCGFCGADSRQKFVLDDVISFKENN